MTTASIQSEPTTQSAKVLKHLQAGKAITPVTAMAVYGISRLSSAIEDIRNAGYKVDTVLKFDEAGKQYGEYRLRRPIKMGTMVQVKSGYGSPLPLWVRKLRASKVVDQYGDSSAVEFISGTNQQVIWMNNQELISVE